MSYFYVLQRWSEPEWVVRSNQLHLGEDEGGPGGGHIQHSQTSTLSPAPDHHQSCKSRSHCTDICHITGTVHNVTVYL